MDEDIMNAVESLFGKDVKIVDCQTSSSVQQEEVLLINGVPVKLDGLPADDASAIKSALLDGQMPSVEHLNQLLFRAGLAQQPIEVETSLTVKSSLTTTEEVLVSRNGEILDERTVETKEHFNHQSHQKEIWQPVNKQQQQQQHALARATPENALKYRTNSNSTCASQATTATGDEHGPSGHLGRHLNQTFSNASIMTNTSSAITSDSDQISMATTLGDKSSNISSCDSGHDGLFHSVSMSATHGDVRDTQTDSMYCDIPSSADEADVASVAMLSNKLHIVEPCDAATDCPSLPAYAKDLPTAGNLDTLVKLLASSSNEDIVFDLLLCARLYVPVQQLLSLIIEESQRMQAEKGQEMLLRLLNQWLRVCANDFRNETLLQELRKHNTDSNISSFLNDDIPETLAQLDTCRRRTQCQYLLSKQSSSGSSLGRQSSIKSLKRFVYKSSDNVLRNCSNAFELAHQLYAIEYAYLSQLRLEEFIEMLATGELKSPKACTLGSSSSSASSCSSSTNPMELSIASYVQWFQQLCALIATEIVKLGKKSQRVHLVEFWIETALECFNTGNFNSLMAILTALQMKAVRRLRKTWSKVQQQGKLEGLQHQMNPNSNYQNYRATLKAAVWRSERETANKIERAIIPYFSLFLKDFHKLNEQHNSRLANGCFNIEKCILLGQQLRDFDKWQRTDCPYEQLPNVVAYLQKADGYAEDALMKASYDCEPPDGSEEKEHYKALKAAK